MPIKQVSPAEAHELIRSGCRYLDVRTEPEFSAGHPATAVNVPVFFRDASSGQMVPNPDFLEVVQRYFPKDMAIVVGCMSGMRSQRACEILEGAGYTDLTNVTGGFGGQRDASGAIIAKGWRDEGLPVSSDVGDAGYQALRKKAGM